MSFRCYGHGHKLQYLLYISAKVSLQTLSSHWLFKWALHTIPKIRWISKHTVSSKNQPGLFLSVYCCKAMLDEFVLFWSFPPIMFSVSYAEAKHAIIRCIPGYPESLLLYVRYEKYITMSSLELFTHIFVYNSELFN